MDFSIKYFKDYISFHVDDSHPVKELLPHPCEEADIEEEEIPPGTCSSDFLGAPL